MAISVLPAAHLGGDALPLPGASKGTPTRRALFAVPLAVAPVAALPASPGAANPDAEMIRATDALIAESHEHRARSAYLDDKPTSEWTAEDRALWEQSLGASYDYGERMMDISAAEPSTADGLIAQATAVLWHFKEPIGDDECYAWNLAESVFRILGRPMPDWAEDGEQKENGEA